MEYANNDHYKWVEATTKKKCSPLGAQVANILGFIGRGIYNCPVNHRAVNWEDEYCVEVNWRHGLSNWDFCDLSMLVIECHRRMVRVTISPNMRHLKLQFWQRDTRDKSAGTSQRMPDIEEVVAMRDRAWNVEV